MILIKGIRRHNNRHHVVSESITVCLVSATWKGLVQTCVASVALQQSGKSSDRIGKYKKVQVKIKKVQECTGEYS